ncbi:MAG: response regulator [Thermodesulfobacteriota bacterium]
MFSLNSKSLNWNIALAFTLLVAVIAVNVFYTTIKEQNRVREAVGQQLEGKSETAHAILVNELEKLKIVTGIVREQNKKIVKFLTYDDIAPLKVMLQEISSRHNLDMVLLYDENFNLLTSNSFQLRHRALHSSYSELLAKAFTPSPKLTATKISAAIMGDFVSSGPAAADESSFIGLQSLVTLTDDIGDPMGFVVLISIINNNQPLAQKMAAMLDVDFAIFDEHNHCILSSFPDNAVPWIEGQKVTVQGKNYFARPSSLNDSAGMTVANLFVAVEDTWFITARRRLIASNFWPFLGFTVISIFLYISLKRRIFNQINRLIDILRKVTESDANLHLRIPVYKKSANGHYDDVEQMCLDFNRMMDRLEETYQQMIIARQEAEAANAAKSDFLANMSHEIRTPMNGILGLADLVLEMDLQKEPRKMLTMVKKSAARLLNVINDILDFSKVEAGKLELDYVDFRLREMAYETMKLLALEGHEKGLEMICRIDKEVPDLFAGDPLRIRQVLINLIGNAIKFTKKGSVSLTIGTAWSSNLSTKKDERQYPLHFVVRDTGIGIPKEKQRIIFDSFHQGEGATTRRYGGTGLGLSISAKLISLMKGEIWVESNPGLGSEFHVVLQPDKQDDSFFTTPCPRELAPLQVFVVEPNQQSLDALAKMLENTAVLVDSAASSAYAVKKMNEKHFDALILAIPEELDKETSDLISLAANQNCRIIPMVRRLDKINIHDLPHHNVSEILTKPVSEEEIYTALSARGGASEAPTNTSPDNFDFNFADVLVVDDDEINRIFTTTLLESKGFQVVTVENGKQAIEAFKDQPFDLVLMDIQMPVMDGLEATALIREFEKDHGKHTPIIALTAHAMREDRQKFLDQGIDGYISKPIDAKLLIKEIRWLLAI